MEVKKIHHHIKLIITRPIIRRAFNFFLFYLGWGFCLSGVVRGRPFEGPIIIAFFLVYHLLQSQSRLSEIVMVGSMALFGTLNDTVYLNLGLIDYKGGWESVPWLAPLWVTSIWALFGMSVNHSMLWLRWSLVLSSLCGMAGGVVSYYAAVRVGAAVFHPNDATVMVILALEWAILMPLITLYSRWLEKAC